MSEKVFKEYCEDCGCPLDICCKPKTPVRLASESVDLKALKEWLNKPTTGYIDHSDCLGNLIHKEVIEIKKVIKWVEKEAKKKVAKK